ncbi:MAG TPA: biosynthetic peptidoglycan transglycosylase [Anaeromyxobacter sp.]|nr:biosynthetic peptidoglycan transglycosylase [Anaeromyxobacter sp.]
MTAPAPARRRRLAALPRLAAWGVAGLLVAYGAAQLVAWHACRSGALRSRLLALVEERLGPVELGPHVRVDRLFRVQFGPLLLQPSRPGEPAPLRVETLRVRPDLAALLRTGRVAPAAVSLEGVRLTFTVRDRAITAGPLELIVTPAPEGDALHADARFPGSGHGAVSLQRRGGGWHVTARVEELDRRALPEGLPAIAEAWAGGTLAVSIEGDAEPGLARVEAKLDARARGLQVAGRLAGAEPIGPVDVAFAGTVAWSGATRRLALDAGRLTLPGGAPVVVAGGLALVDGLPLSFEARADSLDFRRTAEALPPSLALPAGAPLPAGTLDARLRVDGPLLDPAAWRVDAALDLSRMREEARRAAPAAIRSAFVHRAETTSGGVHEFLVGPANPDFVPVSELPRWVVRAVTASEDSGFFGHSGFDFEELRRAAIQGAQAGRVVRGGSTISQQLAKNLYLSREKTFARKLREAMLTVALEASVPKQRLLEVYLNVAEWGPGVWGIGPAARHWFGKDARDLTPREAAFLATVIPNPVRYHYMWNRGWLSDAWEERVDGLLRTMSVQGTLTEEELSAALVESLEFAGRDAVLTGCAAPRLRFN